MARSAWRPGEPRAAAVSAVAGVASRTAAALLDDMSGLRAKVCDFLAETRAAGAWTPRADAWLAGWDEPFSRSLAERGWVGMTVPVEWGGHGRSYLERYVVIEELLAAGAPVAAHWFADRQIAPSLVRNGTDPQRRRWLPEIVRGECFFAVGLSEPEAGSDLAAVRTSATRVAGGWELSGTKVWTSGAHRAHACVVLARTSASVGGRRHDGLSQFIVELPTPGATVRPIPLLTGEHHFNEVHFDRAFVSEEALLGELDGGWQQVVAELAFERSGPERFLSTAVLLTQAVADLATAGGELDAARARVVGALVSRLWSLRQLSVGVSAGLEAGEIPELAAALVKEVGTRFEGELVDGVRQLTDVRPDPAAACLLPRLLAQAVLHSPGYTLRGGTNEVLRGVIARGLGLR
jgi:alkylation response protein AidB-like acyl-CoA dehydrogenase